MQDYNSFSNNLKRMREKAQITQTELAEKIGVTAQTIWRWEHGTREPSIEIIKKIAHMLNCSEADLFNSPTNKKIKVNFLWEVGDDMNEIAIKPHEFNCGYRANDGMLLLWGALPFDMPIDDIMNSIRNEIVAALAGKEARDKKLKELNKKILQAD